MAKYNKEEREEILKQATVAKCEYTDSHFHTTEIMKKGIDIDQLLTDLQDNNYLALDIGIDEKDIEDRYNLLKKYDNIHLSTGVGPWGVGTKVQHDKKLNVLEKNIKNYPIKAIGEIGLDNHWNYGTKKLQADLFEGQISLANHYELPVIIHNREADTDILKTIKNMKFSKNGIIHCFSADLKFAKIALDRGFYISFAGTITYKNNNSLRDVLKYVPLDRLLLETDSPYLTAEPFRGKINTPLLIPLVYQAAATIKKVEISDLCSNVRKNLLNLLASS